MLLHDTIRGSEAEPGTLPRRLGGEERFEQTRQVGRVDTGPGIAHCEHGVSARGQIGLARGQRSRGGDDGNGAAAWLRVTRVEHEIEQHLLDHAAIGRHHQHARVTGDRERVGAWHHAPQQPHVRPHQRIEVEHLWLHGLLTAEHQQLAREPNGALRRRFHVDDEFAGHAWHIAHQPQLLELHENGGEHVVEVVRHAAGQLPNGLHLLTLP